MATGASLHNFAPQDVVAVANVLVNDELVLASTLSRSFESHFGGGKGTIVNVAIPPILKARRRNIHSTDPIVLDVLNQSTFPVTLNDAIYSAVRLDDGDLTLDIVNFAQQVLKPQTTAVAVDVELEAVRVMQSVPANTTIAYSKANPEASFVAARKLLRDMGLPTSGLYAAVGTQVYADLLNSPNFKESDKAGDSEALRNASTGRIRGFDTIESNALAEGELIFYGRASFHLAVRAPIVPDGVAFGAAIAEAGFAMRWIRDYDSMTLADRSVVSTFVGGGIVPVYTLNPANGSLVQGVPAIRVLTTDAEPV